MSMDFNYDFFFCLRPVVLLHAPTCTLLLNNRTSKERKPAFNGA